MLWTIILYRQNITRQLSNLMCILSRNIDVRDYLIICKLNLNNTTMQGDNEIPENCLLPSGDWLKNLRASLALGKPESYSSYGSQLATLIQSFFLFPRKKKVMASYFQKYCPGNPKDLSV